ncbi:phosphatase PAP2 family protein [Bacillus sp. 2205SS5-2]|uniref:phosphatase PAP2 family protein n=1 Tax=Bacillus sp. 2205SS5-2 TaxID=3109031 RepID=UPI003004820E
MQRKFIYLSSTLVLLSIIFSLLVVQGRLDTFDQHVQDWFLSWMTPELQTLMKGITFLGDTKMLAVISMIMLLWLLIKKHFYRLFIFLTMMSGGVIFTFLMKIFIERDRPADVSFIDFWGFGSHLVSYSFPSGHAVKGLLYFGFLILMIQLDTQNRRVKQVLFSLCVAVIILIGVGQLMLNKHFASDVIGGYFVGLTWMTFLYSLTEIIPNYIKKNRWGKRSRLET